MLKKIPGLWLPVRRRLKAARNEFRAIKYRGTARFCPVCGRSARVFLTFGFIPRPEAQCVFCGALERHRLLWIYLTRHSDLFNGTPKRMLHVAPEECFAPRLRKQLGAGYLTADLLNPAAMVQMDVTRIQYPPETFDVIYCSHVLEHVPDDRLAMREFYRVLKTGGWAILLVPITAKKTWEDPSIVDPQARLKVFGQEDHVRRYGPDYIERLREAGFAVQLFEVSDLVKSDELIRLGLTMPTLEGIYVCTKPALKPA